LNEFNRITKHGGKIFIGEMPDIDELAGKNYGDSIVAWLFWVLQNQGVSQFFIRLKQTIHALIGKEPFVIAPKRGFFMQPQQFVVFLEQHGFKVIEYYRHKEIDASGNVYDSPTRWDYFAYKS
jgi:hypothetical protein